MHQHSAGVRESPAACWRAAVPEEADMSPRCAAFELDLCLNRTCSLTNANVLLSVSLQLTSGAACMEAPTTSRGTEVRIAQTQPTAPTAVASTPPPPPPAGCPSSGSNCCLEMPVRISTSMFSSYSPHLRLRLIDKPLRFHASSPAERGSRAESPAPEPAVIGGQRAQHLGDGRGLRGLFDYLQTQRRH